MAHDMVFELTDVRVISTSGAKKKKVPLTNKVGPPHQLVKEQDAWVTGSREQLVDTQLSSPQLSPLGQEELMCVHTRSLSLSHARMHARAHTHTAIATLLADSPVHGETCKLPAMDMRRAGKPCLALQETGAKGQAVAEGQLFRLWPPLWA